MKGQILWADGRSLGLSLLGKYDEISLWPQSFTFVIWMNRPFRHSTRESQQTCSPVASWWWECLGETSSPDKPPSSPPVISLCGGFISQRALRRVLWRREATGQPAPRSPAESQMCRVSLPAKNTDDTVKKELKSDRFIATLFTPSGETLGPLTRLLTLIHDFICFQRRFSLWCFRGRAQPFLPLAAPGIHHSSHTGRRFVKML